MDLIAVVKGEEGDTVRVRDAETRVQTISTNNIVRGVTDIVERLSSYSREDIPATVYRVVYTVIMHLCERHKEPRTMLQGKETTY